MKLIDKWDRIGVILMGALLAITGCTSPQQKQSPSVENIIARMKQNLNLSDEQVRQITPIMEDDIQQKREIRSQGLDQDTVRTKIQAIRQSTEAKLSQYLTPDQLALWKEMRLQPPPSLLLENIITKMKQDLDLSDEQVRQITPIMEDDIQQKREIRSQGLDQDTVRTKIQVIRQSTEAKLSQYLTPDQLAEIRPQLLPQE